MLDFFVIFSKSGIVLFATVNDAFNDVINRLIKHVILEERRSEFSYDSYTLKYHLENEFDLVFVVGYQKILTLSYVDKFLDDIQLAFRDKFNDYDLRKLLVKTNNHDLETNDDGNLLCCNLVDFYPEYKKIYSRCYKMQQNAPVQEMRSFQQSAKSKKTVASMIVRPKTETVVSKVEPKSEPTNSLLMKLANKSPRNRLLDRPKKNKEIKSKEKVKKTKEARQWELGGKNSEEFDFSKKGNLSTDNISSINKNIAGNTYQAKLQEINMSLKFDENNQNHVGNNRNGDYNDDDDDVDDDEDDDDEDDSEVNENDKEHVQPKRSLFKTLMKSFSYNKVLEKSDIMPILSTLRDHLISKNVASEIAVKLCDSVCTKLEGQQVNTWIGLKSFVQNALEESMLRILSPNRNLNILRDIKAKKVGSPYVICFCGVNGVGKSTNLAKIANWLVLNDNRVMIVACDTFRAGAIEQLRTHVTALKAIHEKDGKTKIELYEKGYGKDSAAIAMEAINFARTSGFNVCLVDTAGRMQDNEPLMKQLAKLIKINEPDLTLFVGEALVGNEAVDQLNKFNTSLIDNGCKGVTSNSSAINGIVLTKFDTIDDQVGAAISMTYITGQPIVFVGVGQTYKDLKQLNAKAVVKALMK